MYIQQSNPVKTAGTILGLILFLGWQYALALASDSKQPIEIEADTWELDNHRNITVYTGNVIVIRGSMRMTGDRMTIYYTENNDMDTLIIEGKPATYRQLPDAGQVYDEGRAARMEYHQFENMIILIDDAEVIQERSRFSGERIEFDTELGRIKATSKPKDEGQTDDNDSRVRIIIKPKTTVRDD
jgi:lipopolysaccharide export system protein LptA